MEGETPACDVDRSWPYFRSSVVSHVRTGDDALNRYGGSNVRRVRQEVHSLRYSCASRPATTPDLATIPETSGSSVEDRIRRRPRRFDPSTRAESPESAEEFFPHSWSAHHCYSGNIFTSTPHCAASNYSQGNVVTESNFSYFDGYCCNEDYLKWEHMVDTFFNYTNISQERQVRYVVRKLTGRAKTWWALMLQARHLEGRSEVKSWHKMKSMLRSQFLTTDYELLLNEAMLSGVSEEIEKKDNGVEAETIQTSVEVYESREIKLDLSPISLVEDASKGIEIKSDDFAKPRVEIPCSTNIIPPLVKDSLDMDKAPESSTVVKEDTCLEGSHNFVVSMVAEVSFEGENIMERVVDEDGEDDMMCVLNTTAGILKKFSAASKPAKEFPFELGPFQSEVIKCIENGESVMVSAHTSAGKTVVALYAIAMSLRNQQRVIYTSPIKALSNQKYREFKEESSDVGLMTGDVTIEPNTSCLVMTTEIWRSMQYKGSEVMREVAWIILDEVHYMRDRERGVVWEESIVMAPKNSRFVFLSATAPNAKEFADWVAKIHHQPCHIVYTDYRPTPLQHYICPSSGDGLYLVVDEKGKFREDSFQKALNALVPAKEGSRKRDFGKLQKALLEGKTSEESDIFKLVKMLIQRQYDPVILFSFSKRECEFLAIQMAKMDLNDDQEKINIETIFWSAMDLLSDDERKLPQVSNILPLLKRGIGVHHSGLLTILKEVIEILFQEGLIKCLFATETFSIGLNMPAKTVVFTNVRKFDGENRYTIDASAVQGLVYLPHVCIPSILHWDLICNNILLESKLESYLADFVAAKLMNSTNFQLVKSRMAVSYGYIAPITADELYIIEFTEPICFPCGSRCLIPSSCWNIYDSLLKRKAIAAHCLRFPGVQFHAFSIGERLIEFNVEIEVRKGSSVLEVVVGSEDRTILSTDNFLRVNLVGDIVSSIENSAPVKVSCQPNFCFTSLWSCLHNQLWHLWKVANELHIVDWKKKKKKTLRPH